MLCLDQIIYNQMVAVVTIRSTIVIYSNKYFESVEVSEAGIKANA